MVQPFINKILGLLGILIMLAALGLTGCTEERKREAARLAAELEARERGETLPQDTTNTAMLDSIAASSENAATLQPEDTPHIQASDTVRIGATDTVHSSGSTVAPVQPNDTTNTRQPASGMPPLMRDGYTVQVESSPLENYIHQQVKTFIERGYDAYIGTVTKEGKTYYRLRIGKYTDAAEAARVSAELNSMYNLQSWVDKVTW